ncbi:MAG: 7TM diverse intracellular signaling domain-containing protein [Ginsengibacter sp.]|jgi:signal transduction histidine kinase
MKEIRSYILQKRRVYEIPYLLLLLFTSGIGHAQVIDLKVCDSTDRFAITKYTSILRTTSLIPLDSAIVLNTQNKFKNAPDKQIIVFNYDPYYYWFRIILKNSDSAPKNVMLLMAPIGMKDGQLFQKMGIHWKLAGKTGIKYPFANRPYQYTHFVFPLTIPANYIDTLLLSTDVSHNYKSFGFAIIKPKALKIFENKVYFLFGIIVGLLMLFCTINVYLYFAIKEKIHIWYALYIALVFLIVMKNDHLDQQFLNWDSELAYRLTPLLSIGAIALAVLMHVVQLFLVNIRKTYLYKISLIIKINTFSSGLVFLIFFYLNANSNTLSFIYDWAVFSILLTILVIIFDCIYSITKGFKSAYFILGGLLVFMIGVTQRLIFPSNLSFMFPPSTFHVGIIMETLIITFALIYQYSLDKKAKDLSLKQKMEIVNNHEKLMLQTKSEIQEQTFQNISQEIHDNIGQTLSFIKLNINTINSRVSKTDYEKLTESKNLLTKVIQDLRDLSKTLNTDFIEEIGLEKAIEQQLQILQKSGIYETHFVVNGEIHRFPLQHKLIVYRVVQESLNNIVKHANATSINISMNYYSESAGIILEDNGKGFDEKELILNKGIGFKNMKSRMQLINGSFSVSSIPEKGTSITIEVKK